MVSKFCQGVKVRPWSQRSVMESKFGHIVKVRFESKYGHSVKAKSLSHSSIMESKFGFGVKVRSWSRISAMESKSSAKTLKDHTLFFLNQQFFISKRLFSPFNYGLLSFFLSDNQNKTFFYLVKRNTSVRYCTVDCIGKVTFYKVPGQHGHI